MTDSSRTQTSTEAKCTEHVVAFVDLLGCAEKIRKNSVGTLNQIRNLYIQAKEMCHTGRMAENCSKIKIRIFSDNILFAYETNRQRSHETDVFGPICIMTQYLGVFQSLALSRNLLLRGGLTIGDLYVDDILVWGQGLLRAYELENEIAIYPRIVVDSCIIHAIDKTIFTGGNKFDVCKIGQDTDLTMFIDYLKCYKNRGVNLDPLITNAFNSLVKIDSGVEPNRIWQNIAWQINYMNKYLSFDLWKNDGENSSPASPASSLREAKMPGQTSKK